MAPLNAKPATTFTIYIEGDGLAWRDAGHPSLDPTPRDPLALRLALADPSDAVAYLARPCQFVGVGDATGCTSNRLWTDARFSPSVIAAMNEAVSQLKQRAGARSITLVGFSGGGAVAALIAARRDDVAELITVAGNLDTVAWTTLHQVMPLSDSLNPADAALSLARLPQRHFVGAQDKTMPPAIAASYAQHFPANRQPTIQIIDGFTHACCWVEHWPALLAGERF